MSGSGWKKPFYKVAEQDSKNVAKIGHLLGWEGLEEEGKRNADNPGRAIGKAAQYAATYYLGGLLGGAGEAAGVGAEAATAGTEAATIAAEEAAKQAALEAAKQAGTETAKQGLLQTAKSAGQQGWNSLTDGANSLAYQAAVPGVGSQQAGLLAQQTGDFGAYGLGKTMEAAAGADGLSAWQQALGNYGGKAASLAGKNGPDAAKAYMKSQQISGLMNPQQPQMQQPARPMQGQAEPLANPYGPGGNSMGLLGLSEEEKKKLRAMGYKV